MILLVLLLIFPEWGRLTVRLGKSFGQAVDTNELERASRVGKINSSTSKIIRSVILLVLLSIFPTLDGHSSSFASTVSANDFANLAVNLPHS
jgi:hypothetical protein